MCVLYGVASVSRINKIIGLFCKRVLYKRLCFAKETYNLIDTTDRSHPIDASFSVAVQIKVRMCVCVCRCMRICVCICRGCQEFVCCA